MAHSIRKLFFNIGVKNIRRSRCIIIHTRRRTFVFDLRPENDKLKSIGEKNFYKNNFRRVPIIYHTV